MPRKKVIVTFINFILCLSKVLINKLFVNGPVQQIVPNEPALEKHQSPVFKVWKTIKLGVGPKTSKEFSQAIKNGGYRIDNGTDTVFRHTLLAQDEKEVDVVVVSLKELGFDDGAYFWDICTRAKSIGLELCPAETGLQLCSVFKGEQPYEKLIIGMEPQRDGDWHLRVYVLEIHSGYDAKRKIHSPYIHYLWSTKIEYAKFKDDEYRCRWVFMKPRSSNRL